MKADYFNGQKRTLLAGPRRFRRSRLLGGCALGLCIMAGTSLATSEAQAQEEWEENTRLYEDDAWYDISEWFDGNDYNPTDEAIGRWDDETYDVTQDVGTDQDNDIDWGTYDYGYYDEDIYDNDWYYDYSTDDYSNWYDYNNDETYEYSSQYFDTDNDGLYEAYATYYDSDGDGVYESSSYYYYTELDDEQQKQSQQQMQQAQKQRSSKIAEQSGQVQSVKKVRTPQGENLVVRVAVEDQNQPIVIDLGSSKAMKQMPKEGDQLTARGPVVKLGDATVLIARSVEMNGQTKEINRDQRQLTGKIVGAKKSAVRGVQHQFAKLQTDQGKFVLVDMGPANQIKKELQENMQVTVSGPAVRVDDRRMLIAQSYKVDGDKVTVDRSRRVYDLARQEKNQDSRK